MSSEAHSIYIIYMLLLLISVDGLVAPGMGKMRNFDDRYFAEYQCGIIPQNTGCINSAFRTWQSRIKTGSGRLFVRMLIVVVFKFFTFLLFKKTFYFLLCRLLYFLFCILDWSLYSVLSWMELYGLKIMW